MFLYPNQRPWAAWEGDGRSPSVVARVLQDAEGEQPQVDQVSYAEYSH